MNILQNVKVVGACKLVDFNPFTQIATVYHLGTHKCWQKITTEKIRGFQQKQMQRKGTRTGAAKAMVIEDISYQISIGDMDMAEELADKWSDLHRSKRIQNELDPILSEDHNSFDAVGIIKRKADTKDPYYIYIINNGNLNNDSDYIFKSSKQMTRIALAMNVDGPENVLQLENAYFDAMHTWIYGFKSLGLWMFHPSQRKVLCLACMDIHTENAKDIAKFFTLYNEILQKETGIEGYHFNPHYFMCDEENANYCAILTSLW